MAYGQSSQYGPSAQQGSQYGPSSGQASRYDPSVQQLSHYGPSAQQAYNYGPSAQQAYNYGHSAQQAYNYGPPSQQAYNYGPSSGQASRYDPSVQQPSQYGPSAQQAYNYGPSAQQAYNYGPSAQQPSHYGPSSAQQAHNYGQPMGTHSHYAPALNVGFSDFTSEEAQQEDECSIDFGAFPDTDPSFTDGGINPRFYEALAKLQAVADWSTHSSSTAAEQPVSPAFLRGFTHSEKGPFKRVAPRCPSLPVSASVTHVPKSKRRSRRGGAGSRAAKPRVPEEKCLEDISNTHSDRRSGHAQQQQATAAFARI